MRTITCDKCKRSMPEAGYGEKTNYFVVHTTRYSPMPKGVTENHYCYDCWVKYNQAVNAFMIGE